MGAPLYQLVSQHRDLMRFADEGEVDPHALLDTLEGLTGAIEVKAQSVAMFIRNLEASAEAIEAAAKAMAERASKIRDRADGIKTYLLTNMQAAGITKISCEFFTLSIRKNPPRVDVLDEISIPDRFLKWPEPPPPAPDKKALLEALKAGEEVPGVQLAQSERLEIKT